MVFSSPYFLWLFLPFALAVCLPLRRIAYLPALFAVSIAFYFWSAGVDTLVLLGLIAANYVFALKLARSSSRFVFALLLLANLSILFWYKYAAFVARILDGLLGTHLGTLCGVTVLPAGVSFFVFQAISYLVDVRRADIEPERKLMTYGSYQAFFPHLIAGPIVRFRDVIGDLNAPRWSVDSFSAGLARFVHGLAKKTLIADSVAPIANATFALTGAELDMPTAWFGALAYSLQIYFDFSGYSDMAIGLAQLFGVRFHENFERPYASRSITEFWRRWHISLSSWFRDYLYIPLGGSRAGAPATYRNLLIVFGVTGLWHGAAWTFLVWGLYHGLFLVLERALVNEPIKTMRHRALRYAYCLPVVVFGWVLFRASSLRRTFAIWRSMVVPRLHADGLPTSVLEVLNPYVVTAFAVGLLAMLFTGPHSLGRRLLDEQESRTFRVVSLGYTLLALSASGLLMISGSYSPFLYFNF